MPLVVLLALLLISNWFFSEVLVFVPLNFLNSLGSVGWFCLLLVLFVLFSWCFGE
ncbi:MAG: hypothetical protein AB4426_26715 [Xenococcaceae cyanobacterium]